MSNSKLVTDSLAKIFAANRVLSVHNDQHCRVSDAPTLAEMKAQPWWRSMDKPVETGVRVVCNRCTRCGSYVGHARAGCLTCGTLALEIVVTDGTITPHIAAVQAAQESAQAVIVVARYLDSLECDADDPLSVIRRQTHAPLRRALNKALDKMTESKIGR